MIKRKVTYPTPKASMSPTFGTWFNTEWCFQRMHASSVESSGSDWCSLNSSWEFMKCFPIRVFQCYCRISRIVTKGFILFITENQMVGLAFRHLGLSLKDRVALVGKSAAIILSFGGNAEERVLFSQRKKLFTSLYSKLNTSRVRRQQAIFFCSQLPTTSL